MASIDLPQCQNCKHLWRDEKGYKCDAFPVQIPEEIMLNEFDHTQPHEDDQGIQFEPIEPELRIDE